MKRSFFLSVLLTLVILVSSSCGGTNNEVLEPSEKLSQKTEGKIDQTGVITENIILAAADKSFAVEIDAGTKALDKNGEPIEIITLNPPGKTPAPPENIINIKRISIKENKGEAGSLDAVLQVVTLKLQAGVG